MTRLQKNKRYFTESLNVSNEIKREIETGLKVLGEIEKPIVTFFGSHKTTKADPLFEHCYNVARELGKSGYTILTGGDSGFAYAASMGAKDSETESVGLHSSLLKSDYEIGEVYSDMYSFEFLFARRFLLAAKSEALVFYPGGFSTLNEFFEYLFLMETGIVDKVPVICVGREFWQSIREWLKLFPEKAGYFTRATDLDLFTIVDEVDQVVTLVKE